MSLVKYLGYASMLVGIFVSIIVLSIVLNNKSYNKDSVNWLIAGYSVTTFGILLLFSFNILKNWGTSFNYNLIPLIVQICLLLFILILTLYLNIAYMKQISENKVSETYIICSLISALLLLVQIGGFYKLLSYKKENQGSNSKLILGLLIIFVINMWTLVTATNSLLYFSTDG